NPRDPQRPEQALLHPAVAQRILAAAPHGLLGALEQLRTAAPRPLRRFQHLLAPCARRDAILYPGHCSLLALSNRFLKSVIGRRPGPPRAPPADRLSRAASRSACDPRR